MIFVLNKHEYAFEANHELVNTLSKNQLESKLLFDQKTRTYKTELAVNAEKEITKAALEEKLEEIKKQPYAWKELLKKGRMMPDV